MNQNKGYAAFCQYVKEKNFALIGIGVSNLPLVSFLLKSGAKSVSVRDLKKTKDSPEVIQAKKDGARITLDQAYLDELTEDVIIRSPGIRPDIPPFSDAKKKGKRITCETELFLQFCPCKIVAVTGSDGKTTTTTLIYKILEKAGHTVYLGGNIGKPILPQLDTIDQNPGICVLELSSFQLTECSFSPDVSVITNLSENHLDWHVDMNEYLDAKKNIFRHQTKLGKTVLNFNNDHTNQCEPVGSRIYFSLNPTLALLENNKIDAVYLKDGVIFLRKDGVETAYFSAENILLPGTHNIDNYMAAIAATHDLVKQDDVLAIAQEFGGVEHRIELVRTLDGVKYYNSSIDSSPARSKAALLSFSERVIMIAGGYDKNLDYSELGDIICQRVKILILCGATAQKIRDAVLKSSYYNENSIQVYTCAEFAETVPLARTLSRPNDVVILSPASASFDLFVNFEQRGRYFKELVKEL